MNATLYFFVIAAIFAAPHTSKDDAKVISWVGIGVGLLWWSAVMFIDLAKRGVL